MKCLVTGATGFLGTNLVHELVKEGWSVRAMANTGKGSRFIKDLPVELIHGDLTNPNDADRAVRNVDVVFNLAGDTSWGKKNYQRQRRINVEGPVNLAEACRKNGVKTIIHTSTVDTLGFNPDGLADESWPLYNYKNTGYNYADTKREGEKRILEYNSDELGVVIIYPGGMMGPFDFSLQYGRLFFDIAKNKIPACTPGGLSCCHVTEVARAHIAAMRKGKPGEGYICGGVNITHRELFEAIADKMRVKAPRFTMPEWFVVAYGRLMDFISGFTGKEPSIDAGVARHMSKHAYYDSSKAVRELEYKIVPLRTMIDDSYDWYVKEGYISHDSN